MEISGETDGDRDGVTNGVVDGVTSGGTNGGTEGSGTDRALDVLFGEIRHRVGPADVVVSGPGIPAVRLSRTAGAATAPAHRDQGPGFVDTDRRRPGRRALARIGTAAAPVVPDHRRRPSPTPEEAAIGYALAAGFGTGACFVAGSFAAWIVELLT